MNIFEKERKKIERYYYKDILGIVLDYVCKHYNNILNEDFHKVPVKDLLVFFLDNKLYHLASQIWNHLGDERKKIGVKLIYHYSYKNNFRVVQWLLMVGCPWRAHIYTIFMQKSNYFAMKWFDVNGFHIQETNMTTMNYQIPKWKKRMLRNHRCR